MASQNRHTLAPSSIYSRLSNSTFNTLPTYHSRGSSSTFISREYTPSGRLHLSIAVDTSITRTISAADPLNPHPSQQSGSSGPSHKSNPSTSTSKSTSTCVDSATPWDDPIPFAPPSTSDFSQETTTTSTLISHDPSARPPLYQLSSPLSASPPPASLTISRLIQPSKPSPENVYANTAAKPKVEALYTLRPLPTLRAGTPQVHRCQIRALRSAPGIPGVEHGRTGEVALGLNVRGLTTAVTFATGPVRVAGKERPVVRMSHRKWRDGAGNVVAVSQKRRSGEREVAEVEFVDGVEEEVRDLVVAAWVAGVWLRVLVPRVGGREMQQGKPKQGWKWRQREQFPLRDEFVKMGWKENGGRGV